MVDSVAVFVLGCMVLALLTIVVCSIVLTVCVIKDMKFWQKQDYIVEDDKTSTQVE